MPEQMFTKCPHCGTTFRLSLDQLKVAGGAVRCGSCFQVFHAAGHIVRAGEADATSTASDKPKARTDVFDGQPDNKDKSSFDSSIPQLGDEPAAAPAPAPAAERSPATAPKPVTAPKPATAATRPEPEPKPEPKPEPTKKDDWAESMLKELDEKISTRARPATNESQRARIPNPGLFGKDKTFSFDSAAFRKKPETHPPEPEESARKLAPKPAPEDDFRKRNPLITDDPFNMDDLGPAGGEPNDSDDADESWAQSMLDDLEPNAKSIPRSTAKVSTSDPSHLDTLHPDDERLLAIKQARRDKLRADASGNAMRHLNPRSAAQAKRKAAETAAATSPQPAPATEQAPAPQTTPPTRTEDDWSPSPLIDDNDDENSLSDGDFDNDVSTHYDRPADLDWRRPQAGQPLWLGAGCGLMLIILLIQYVHFNASAISAGGSLRPLLAPVCAMTGCKIGLPSDPRRIISSNLAVKSHPDVDDALTVDAILINQASYTQALPAVELRFEDMGGALVASRTFQPGEYIEDATVLEKQMPTATPINFHLEIADPGQAAVNYQLRFHPPSPSNN